MATRVLSQGFVKEVGSGRWRTAGARRLDIARRGDTRRLKGGGRLKAWPHSGV